MKFKIVLHREVTQEDAAHFDSKTKDKIKKKVNGLLGENPDLAGEALRGELTVYRKLKIFDDIRIIYRVDRQRHRVLILAVGIRRDEEVYKRALRRLQER